MSNAKTFKPGDMVYFRGQFSKEFSLRGRVERWVCYGGRLPDGSLLGVRLENGNYSIADLTQVRHRDEVTCVDSSHIYEGLA